MVFQALRIYVYGELDILEAALLKAADCLSINGRMAVITFHSLEDGVVKRTFKRLTQKKHVNIYKKADVPSVEFSLVTKKPIPTSSAEAKQNKRARSAKLRVIEKIGEER